MFRYKTIFRPKMYAREDASQKNGGAYQMYSPQQIHSLGNATFRKNCLMKERKSQPVAIPRQNLDLCNKASI